MKGGNDGKEAQGRRSIHTWHRTLIWVSLSKTILVGLPDINLCPTVPATQYLQIEIVNLSFI